MDMKIKHEKAGGGGRFYIDDGGRSAGELTYKQTGDAIDIDHTEVDDKLRGEGLGEDLVNAAVRHAEDNGLQVNATCPYAKKVIGEKEGI